MLRTKGGDEHRYKSSDEVNDIDWSVLKEGNREFATMQYYKGLIEMRKTFGIFSDVHTTITHTELGSGALALVYDNGMGVKATVVINPCNANIPYHLDGEWNLVANGENAGSAVLARHSGNITVPAMSVAVYVSDALLNG